MPKTKKPPAAFALPDRPHFGPTFIAGLLHVSPRTVQHWCDVGLLGSFRMPGGGPRRVPRAALAKFLAEQPIAAALGLAGEKA